MSNFSASVHQIALINVLQRPQYYQLKLLFLCCKKGKCFYIKLKSSKWRYFLKADWGLLLPSLENPEIRSFSTLMFYPQLSSDGNGSNQFCILSSSTEIWWKTLNSKYEKLLLSFSTGCNCKNDQRRGLLSQLKV